MPRKTLALISALVVVTIVLFVVALQSAKKTATTPTQQTPTAMQPEPTTPAHSVLSLSPNPVTVQPGGRGSVDVMLDTSDNNVTAVEFLLSYDPAVISNVQVIPGPMFKNPTVLKNRNNPQTSKFLYAIVPSPNNPTVTGKGVVATVTFTAKPGTLGRQTELSFSPDPDTLVSARGIAKSVLKSSTGAVVTVGAAVTSGASGSAQQPR